MKPGSLVVLKQNYPILMHIVRAGLPVTDQVYTVKETGICCENCKKESLTLEETRVRDRVDDDGGEYMLPIEDFRELELPLELQEVLTKELIK